MIRRIGVLTVLAALLSAAGLALAAPESAAPAPQILQLARDPESTVALPPIQVTRYPDGRIHVHGSGHHVIGDEGIQYRVEFDLQDNTYKAVAQ